MRAEGEIASNACEDSIRKLNDMFLVKISYIS